jgi:hypothetical protein
MRYSENIVPSLALPIALAKRAAQNRGMTKFTTWSAAWWCRCRAGRCRRGHKCGRRPGTHSLALLATSTRARATVRLPCCARLSLSAYQAGLGGCSSWYCTRNRRRTNARRARGGDSARIISAVLARADVKALVVSVVTACPYGASSSVNHKIPVVLHNKICVGSNRV